jgi:hypothetical protein
MEQTTVTQPIALKPRQDAVEAIVNSFISKGRRKSSGGYRISEDGKQLTYTTSGYGEYKWDHASGKSVQVYADTLAVRIEQDGQDFVIGNSSGLRFVGARMAWGSRQRPRGEQKVQRLLAAKVPMLPFSVFEQAKLDITKTRILERGQAETVKRKAKKYDASKGKNVTFMESVHFTGASLFDVEGTQFLFDIDREEIKHGIFNPFLVKLPKKVKTIAEAYESLKPAEVLRAEKAGLKVQRQGEWFFIPVKGRHTPDKWKTEEETNFRWAQVLQKNGKWRDAVVGDVKRLELRAGPNRPNEAEMGIAAKQLVKGRISHSGREHRDIVLETWHKAVPNTATESFTITGDID